ncbi:F-box/FBD/LRR-repeat protein At5g56420-like [Primulina eburnea]|uniref:F-box/FBD/LRR-repeat protein At5g56420-like n=1 Tax=Primulina eburnea TaxID=1245227 RepID=UPI003C6C04DB
MDSMDIISSLPDPILCHILSFLPNHFSAKTSVLARRWRYLWNYVRDRRFNDLEYYKFNHNCQPFSDMVDNVLSLHNGSIDSLIIRSDDVASQCQIDAWISTAIARNVQVLRLCDFSDVTLTQCRFKCNSLIELTLQNFTISAKPGDVCLPRLKKLHLRYNCYENDESLPNLVSGCLAIEDLFVERKLCDNMGCCYVSSPTLKSFVLWSKFHCYMLECHYEHKVVLDIPAVQYLDIKDKYSRTILSEKLSSMVVAKSFLSYDHDSEANIRHWRNLSQLVERLSNAKSQTFRSCTMMEHLNPTFSFATTRFHNLIKVELEADWYFLTELLESAYKLEYLTVREVNEVNCWREPKNIPECLLSTLKYVSISGFAGGEHELNMVSYIMMHAKVLKSVRIDTKSRCRRKDIHSKLVSYLPRGSHECRLTFI